MKIERLFLDFDGVDLVLKAKTPIREIVLWKTWMWMGNNRSLIDKIEQIAKSNTLAILHFKDEHPLIKEFAQIKIMEFPNETIEMNINIIPEYEIVSLHASQLL